MELIRAAYRSARSRTVALALRGVSRQSVDRALDSVVDARADSRGGVVYVDADDIHDDLLLAAGGAALVITATDAFRLELQKRGIRTCPLEHGARLLRQTWDDPQRTRNDQCQTL